jgi:hypothetical protein
MSSSLQKVEVGASLGSLGEANFIELGDLKSVFDSLLSFMDLGGVAWPSSFQQQRRPPSGASQGTGRSSRSSS